MLEDLLALGVLMTIIGYFVYAQAPRHWQTPLGLLIIVFGWVPAGLLLIILFKHPAALVPAVFILGVLLTRRRAS